MKEYYLSVLRNTVMFVDEYEELPDCVKALNEEAVHKLCIIAAAKEQLLDIDLPELIQKLDNYAVDFSIHNYFDLGRYWIENMVPDEGEASHYLCYVDYKRLGKDLCADGVGMITKYGILWNCFIL